MCRSQSNFISYIFPKTLNFTSQFQTSQFIGYIVPNMTTNLCLTPLVCLDVPILVLYTTVKKIGKYIRT